MRHQVELLREIARQQAQDIDARDAECKWLSECLRRRGAAAVSSEVPPGKPEIDALIATVKAEVERLQREIGVWRGASWGPVELAWSSDQSTERKEELSHELECQRWHAERSRLERQLLEAQERIKQYEAVRAAGPGAELADVASAEAEAGYFRDELAAERSAASLARERLAAARLEAEEERRSRGRLLAQSEQALTAVAKEIALAERRIEVENDLQRAQQAQLHSVQSTVVTLKAQVQRAQHESSELSASLEQNQATLRRLRQ